jgi:class 3 adenylate cyclase
MERVEVSRTLVKSPPELWEELQGDCIAQAVGAATVEPAEPERELRWAGDGVAGTARIEPSNWGTKVILRAEVEERVAELGFWARLRGAKPPPPRHPDLEQRLEGVLDRLGSDSKKPFARE